MTFSINDAKNEAGEWIMSPEQIRAEMAADLEPVSCQQCGGRGHESFDCDYDPYDDDEEDEDE